MATNGNDTIYGTSGNDILDALLGNDLVFGFDGNDWLYGNGGDDRLYGGSGFDSLYGGSGNDYMSGGSESDTLVGGGGTDTAYGGDGEDRIYSSGLGFYSGDAGNDYIYAANGAAETLRGGIDTDWLDTTHWSNNYTINLATGLTNYVGESFTEFENLYAGSGSDNLTGTDGINIIYANDGNDVINGAAGDDYLHGGNGNDTVDGGDGGDSIWGGAGNDSLVGGNGWNRVYGEDGDDIIRSGGTGIYDGGAGNDYVYAATGTPEDLRGGIGIDWLNTTHWSSDYTINLGTGVTNYGGETFTQFEHLVAGSGNDSLTGTDDANMILAGAGNDHVDGLGGNDSLYGQDGNDSMDGGLGDDYLSGGLGNDILTGGGGNDSVYGGDGNDTLRSSGLGTFDGGAGNDYVYAASGTPEVLRGGTGTDWLNTTHWSSNYTVNLGTGATNWAGESFTEFENLFAGSGSDSLTGTNGANIIYAGAGNDTVDGLGGNDTLTGMDGNDVLYGGLGNDLARGGNGNDRVFGNDGNDVLNGGTGVDFLYGGGGEDSFRFYSAAESSSAAGIDVIRDFQGAGIQLLATIEDRIDLSSIDANSQLAGNQAFTFNGTTAGQMGRVWVQNVGTETYLYVNSADNIFTNLDDFTAEMAIRITDGAVTASNYWSGDFVL